MSEDRAAQAALAVDTYLEGLRGELTILGARDRDAEVSDIREILLDAVRTDPERVFAEMARLGDPAKLASAILAERGIAGESGLPSAAWWRVTLAAIIDTAIVLAGLAFIGGFLIAGVGYLLYEDAAFSKAAILLSLVVPGGMLALVVAVAWGYASPWRGGDGSTIGFVITGTARRKIAGRVRFLNVRDLAERGLPVAKVRVMSFRVIVPLLVAASLWMSVLGQVHLGPIDTADAIEALAPDLTLSEALNNDVNSLYEAAYPGQPSDSLSDQYIGPEWPLMSGELGLDVDALKTDLRKRMVGPNASHETNQITEIWEGEREVEVTESNAAGSRRVVLTYRLVIRWRGPAGQEPHGYADWMLVDYQPVPGSEATTP